jgi:hypothetical protein
VPLLVDHALSAPGVFSLAVVLTPLAKVSVKPLPSLPPRAKLTLAKSVLKS